jgi:hypothetical protein
VAQESIAAMTPTDSTSAGRLLPSLALDVTTADALLKAGDSVPTGKAFLDKDLNTVIEARVRQGFGLPPNATEEQVNAQLQAHMAARSTPMPAPANVNPTKRYSDYVA